ncbi:MAG TPA: DUF1697 domain-containing protein [Bryobacteraceae bacterium]
MRVVISMLRGINLASHNRVKMDALRTLYESLELEDPTTFLQSGNVIFKTRERNLVRLAKKIEDGIERTFGFHSDIILRTTEEVREAVAKNPFVRQAKDEPSKLLVTFLVSEPSAEARASVLKIKCEPEELRIGGRELYIYFPDGMARPKLSIPVIERVLKTSGTGRNWNTVMKLLETAETLEGKRESA